MVVKLKKIESKKEVLDGKLLQLVAGLRQVQNQVDVKLERVQDNSDNIPFKPG